MPDGKTRGMPRVNPQLWLDMTEENPWYSTQGTSFPPYPRLWEQCFRTDIRGGMMFRWNGTYWLSEQEYSVAPIAERSFDAGAVVEAYMGHPTDGLDYYLTTFDCAIYSVNVGATYLTCEMDKRTSANVGTSLFSFTTAGDTAGVWAPHNVTVNHLVDVSTYPVIRLAFTATAGVTDAYFSPTLYYRLRAT